MSNIINRSSVLAIKVEATEGTPVAPASASDFIALQDDFDVSPQFDQLENAELKNSIGKGKTITGAENPTASGSHYLRHSGVEGTAPGYGMILEGAFGSKDTESVEYTTTSGSTVSSVAITSIGTNGIRGQALLLKDGANGYAIRPIHSTTTNACVPGFNLTAAPASGVAIGKPITYYPANSSHNSYSIWHYLGNGGATQLVSGAKFTELSLSFAAGELINMAYSAEGLGYYFNPIEITSSTKYIDFTDDDGTFAAVLPVQWYKDPHDLAAAVKTAMDTANSGETHTCTYSNTTGKFTILSTGTVLTLKWNTGANTANTAATKLGFSAAADSSGTAATTGYTSASALSFAASYTPSYDSSDPLAAKAHELFIGDATDTTAVSASNVSFTLTNTRAVIGSVSATSGRSGSIFSARMAKMTVTALLDKYEAARFRKYRTNEDTRALYNFGTKSGGNWVAGKCGCIYMPTCTISSFDLVDKDGLVALEMELTAYVDNSANGEVYMSFV
jgi:hypothetical protein